MVAFPDPTPAGARKVSARLPPVLSRSAHLRKDMVWAGLKTAKSYRGLYTKTAGHRKLAFIYLVSEWLRCKNSHLAHPWLTVVQVLQITADSLHEGLD